MTAGQRNWHGWTVTERFMVKVAKDDETGCWQWQAAKGRGGYGHFWLSYADGVMLAHRAAHLLFKGEIPDDLTVDHLCFNPGCVNPDHLQLLTLSENAGRLRKALSSHCKRGHEFTPENTRLTPNRTGGGNRDMYRACRTCMREGLRRRRAKRAQAARAHVEEEA